MSPSLAAEQHDLPTAFETIRASMWREPDGTTVSRFSSTQDLSGYAPTFELRTAPDGRTRYFREELNGERIELGPYQELLEGIHPFAR